MTAGPSASEPINGFRADLRHLEARVKETNERLFGWPEQNYQGGEIGKLNQRLDALTQALAVQPSKVREAIETDRKENWFKRLGKLGGVLLVIGGYVLAELTRALIAALTTHHP